MKSEAVSEHLINERITESISEVQAIALCQPATEAKFIFKN